jgi:hypothetical protein
MTTAHPNYQVPKTSLLGDGIIRSAKTLGNPSLFDALAGAVVMLVSIVGLSGGLPRTLSAFAFIVVGVAFIVEAAGTTRRSQNMTMPGEGVRSQVTGSALAESFAGSAGLVLGVVALVGFEPYLVLPVASIAFGVALLFGTGAALQVDIVAAHLEPSPTRRAIHEAVVGASGARLLVSFGCVVLGVLALAGVERVTLTLTAALGLGVALLLGSVSLGDRLATSHSPSEYES